MNDQAGSTQEPPMSHALGQLSTAIDRLRASLSDLHGRLETCSSPSEPEPVNQQSATTSLAGDSEMVMSLRERTVEVNAMHEGVLARLRRLEL